MARYNEMFKLNCKDINLIESAVREQIAHLSPMHATQQHANAPDNHKQIVELMGVLGTLHNQKIWYGQLHHTGIPLG